MSYVEHKAVWSSHAPSNHELLRRRLASILIVTKKKAEYGDGNRGHQKAAALVGLARVDDQPQSNHDAGCEKSSKRRRPFTRVCSDPQNH